jgi:hypothetical protein
LLPLKSIIITSISKCRNRKIKAYPKLRHAESWKNRLYSMKNRILPEN